MRAVELFVILDTLLSMPSGEHRLAAGYRDGLACFVLLVNYVINGFHCIFR